MTRICSLSLTCSIPARHRSGRLVLTGHPSTPSFNEPPYPIERRRVRARVEPACLGSVADRLSPHDQSVLFLNDLVGLPRAAETKIQFRPGNPIA